LSVALEPEFFPVGWGEAAEGEIVAVAENWVAAQQTHAYRRVWYDVEHGYFSLTGWGQALYKPLRSLVAAWRLTGDATYRESALLGLDYHQGSNGQGLVGTTGLGEHHVSVALHLPSWADGIDEVTPGITIFGGSSGIPWQARTTVYGLAVDARADPPFVGVEMALMPPPWDNDSLTIDELGEVLYEVLPQWRRLVPLEANLPAVMEFTVRATTSPAAAVTGSLMGSGWSPSTELSNREPRTEEELRSSLWLMP
jgi:hypothetical protein